MPHVIRLRGRWEQESLDGERVRFSRRFHRPTGLDGGSRVWLVIEDFATPDEVRLNRELLRDFHNGRCDITSSLLPSNLLTITVASSRPLGQVRLEIENSQGERGA